MKTKTKPMHPLTRKVLRTMARYPDRPWTIEALTTRHRLDTAGRYRISRAFTAFDNAGRYVRHTGNVGEYQWTGKTELPS